MVPYIAGAAIWIVSFLFCVNDLGGEAAGALATAATVLWLFALRGKARQP